MNPQQDTIHGAVMCYSGCHTHLQQASNHCRNWRVHWIQMMECTPFMKQFPPESRQGLCTRGFCLQQCLLDSPQPALHSEGDLAEGTIFFPPTNTVNRSVH